MEEKLTVDPKDAQDNKLMAILAYLGILFLVPYLAAKESPFAKFHANQGCTLFIVEIAISILATVLGYIPFIGWILAILMYLLSLGCFVLAILGIINAAKGEAKEIPLIGKYKILK